MPAPSSDTFARLRSLISIPTDEPRELTSVVEPFTGTELATVPMGTEEDVKHAVEQAREAQAAWTRVPVGERAAILDRYQNLVIAHKDELMDMAQAETGKSRMSAMEETLDVAIASRYYAKNGPAMLEPVQRAGLLPGLTKTIERRQAKGVVGIVSPWNYPLTLAVTDALPALLAGNAIVLKPDRQTPHTALLAVELLIEAGLPKALFQVVTGAGSVVGTAIVDTCDYLMFTGSTATGKVLAKQTGERLIGFSAELGGKNAMIVTAGADLAKVADGAVRACFANSGQLCISIERIYVERTIADEFTRVLGERVRAMKLAGGYSFGSDMGSLASAAQLAGVSAHVDDAVAKGATVVAGGKARPDLGPFFYEPTVLTGVGEDMECARAETFGPVVAIYEVADVEEAIGRANDTEYGLNASVWAATTGAGEAIAARLRAGTVNVNEGYIAAWGSTDAPMGGMGASGVGRRHGVDGLHKYTESQTIAVQRGMPVAPPKGMNQATFAKLMFSSLKVLRALPGR